MNTDTPDMVNHPSHYNVKGFEVIDIIDAFGLNFNMGNALKYLLRADRKGNKEQDINKAYSKQYFDPNCRRERIMFQIPGYDQFMTTIGKLNFFRWALDSKILEYIEEHEDDIRKGYNSYLKDMIQTQKNNKVVKEQPKEQPRATRRRTKQSPSSLNKLQVYKTPVELTFD